MSEADRLDVVREAFDRRAATYDDSVMHRELAAFVADFVEVTGVRDVLDVATGTGLVLRAVHRRGGDLRLTGVDISTGMLAVAREELPDASWIGADAAALPIADRSMDLITCVTALHAIPDTRATLAEWHRVLRPDGRVVTATFAEERPPGSRVRRNAYPSDHEPYSTVDRITNAAGAAGFRIVRTTTWTGADDTLLVAEWMRTP
ncbi:MAG TPA: methyltransferase domain-containing protein [Microbacterium sp.]|nr:methyltransferase domain-containing protein [Microbacterium sp.]